MAVARIISDSRIVGQTLRNNLNLPWAPHRIGLYVALRFGSAIREVVSLFCANRTVNRRLTSPGTRLERLFVASPISNGLMFCFAPRIPGDLVAPSRPVSQICRQYLPVHQMYDLRSTVQSH